MYLVKTPSWVKRFFSSLTWDMPAEEKTLYITFDDGPIPEVTPWVVNVLNNFNAKATFFCVGENVETHSSVYNQVVDAGHSVGNHTFNHLNGWFEKKDEYQENISQCEGAIDSNLFRPPYGKIKPSQYKSLQEKDYEVIMWDVLSGDFDDNITKEECFSNVINNAGPGSIIVFHDSLKAKDKLKYVLPKTLQYFSNLGYSFKAIPSKNYAAA